MTMVDVCGQCDTLFVEGEEHCSRCGADRSEAVKREMKDLCHILTEEDPEEEEVTRTVKPIFFPKWGKPQWYEGEEVEEGAERAEDIEDGGE